jgi:HD-GYP domain-containing protein (c-di-GMP phosphodiesterase class II)
MRVAWPFSRSLIYPLTAILVALAVLPLALVGWGFVTTNQEQVSTLEKQYLTRQAVGLAREVELYFLDSVGHVETLSQGIRPNSQGVIDVGGASTMLQEFIKGHENIILLRLLGADGQGPFVQRRSLSGNAESALEEILREAFADNLRGRPARRDLLRFAGEEPLVLTSLPLVDGSGKVAGALQGVVSLAGLASRIADESSRGVIVDVVDKTGMVVFSSEPGRVGRSAEGHPLVSQFLRAPVRLTKTYRDPLTGSAANVLGSLCPVGDPPWAVVTARELDVAFAAVRAMARRTVIIAVVAGLLAMVAGGLLARRITTPLRNLAEVTSAVAEGDLTRRVPVRSRNELGRLGDNFNAMAVEIERYVGSLRQALQENQELLVDAIRALAAAIDAKSPYTRGHSERVSEYAVAIGKQLGLDDDELRKLQISALLHDVGKIGIEDAILQKPGTLTEGEFAQMRAHPLKGAAIVSPIKRLKDMLSGIRSHHENWSGGGYPDGLVGEDIPVAARVIATADVFDAMTTHRPYQRALGLESVYDRIRELSGTRLDPAVVGAFFAAIETGELVPLGQMEVASA